jgi:5-enolpyruvylshikimate-3-phosphate synthase
MNQFIKSLLALAALGTAGCSFAARSPEMYRDDTQALLETRHADIKACYDNELKSNANLTGRVTVHFIVEKDTGRITNVAPVPAGTTADEKLTNCVISAIDGLVLTPPDNNDGDATFVYDFTAEPAPAG